MQRPWLVIVIGALLGTPPVLAQPVSGEALTVLTTIGFLVGAANQCGVASNPANAAASGLAIAIGGGGYGSPAEAHTIYNRALQRGAVDARDGKADCGKVASLLTEYVDRLLSKSSGR